MVRGIVVAMAAVCSSAAWAGDKPIYAPPPAWVKPVALPPLPAKADEAAVRTLLADQQIAFEDGGETSYLAFAILIQTSQGLDAGNISFPWKPDTGDLIVHRLLIHRGGRIIDVLAGGQTFTVMRRETNLESATLDGVLTANIQPEGLQVGDVLDVAVSITSRDPVMKGHVETLVAQWDSTPVARTHLRLQWPSSLPLRLRQSGGLPALKPVRSGATSSIELSFDGVEPIPGPKGAPLRYQFGRRVEASDYASWADLAALFAPLFRSAAAIPPSGPLADEVARIKALSTDPAKRTEAALALVQNRIRYVALAMGSGGYVPADAATTWSRRYGDCKAKTVLLLAMLDALGIAAEPVLVSTQLGDGMDARLPMIGAFDHVVVRAQVAGRHYWLDGTRKGDGALDRLAVPGFRWGLPLAPTAAALVRIVQPPLDRPTSDTVIRLDATAGLAVPAPARVETVLRGDMATAANLGLANLAGDARDRALKAYWKAQYDFIEPTKVAATFDPQTGEQRLTLEGQAKMDWSTGWYETDGTSIGYKADFARDPGPNRDAPFAVPYPYHVRTEETILLPPGFSAAKAGTGGNVERTVAGIEYRRIVKVEDGVFRVEKTERSVADEFPAKDAPAAQAALREMAEATLYIRTPPSYRLTPGDLAAAEKTVPKTADAFVKRGYAMLDARNYEAGIRDLDSALALEPRNALALANRGIARAWLEMYDLAEKDIAAALAIDPRQAVAYRARGLMAYQKGEHRAAVDAFNESLRYEAQNSFALGYRAQARRGIGENDGALADATAALADDPKWIDLYLLRANIYRARGEHDRVVAEALAAQAADPGNSFAQVAAGNILGSEKRTAEAMRAFDAALAIEPAAYIYLNRAYHRAKDDRAGRKADIDAALKLEPTMVDALMHKARWQADGGDQAGAILTYGAAIAAAPDQPSPLSQRGVARFKAGDVTGGTRDFAAARALAKTASALNNLCWIKATAGIALDQALVDCDAALALEPDAAAFLDSKGLVLLRLGRIDTAIQVYDRALAKEPDQAASLFGRAVARATKGDKVGAAADLARARTISPDVVTHFGEYGVTMPTP